MGADLLAASEAATGGLVLGRATPGVASAAKAAGIAVFEMKDDRALAVSNATAVAQALVGLLIGKTRRVLQDHRLLVIGYGATGAAFTGALLGLACAVRVTARRPEHLARGSAEPSRSATPCGCKRWPSPTSSSAPCRRPRRSRPRPSRTCGKAVVLDIASPPGGIDHAAASASEINLTWARGLAGARAPLSAGDAQLRIITDAISGMGQRRN